ncbi:homoaconitate hydratase [Salmonella enterica subsp. enterica serovar Sandiego]|nr:homoaconitate hydratase [Salmonella enterica subsp. enterica serovar Sandiego]
MEKELRIYDNTLRDGEQTPGVSFSQEVKLNIASMLSEIGVTDIEVGFPAVSEQEKNTIKAIVQQKLKTRLHVLSRLCQKDIIHALDCGIENITLFYPAPAVVRERLGITDQDSLFHIMGELIPFAVQEGITVKFSCENASRYELNTLCSIYKHATELGSTFLSYPDTAGILIPKEVINNVSVIRSRINTPVSMHCHNDLGLAVANTIAGYEAGAAEVQACINGMGERAGNAALEEILVILIEKYGMQKRFNMNMARELSEYVYKTTNLEPAFNKPQWGKHVFLHESGMHVESILKKENIYQAYDPEIIGRQHKVVLGKHSGYALMEHILSSIEISDSKKILKTIKEKAELGTINEDTLKEIGLDNRVILSFKKYMY